MGFDFINLIKYQACYKYQIRDLNKMASKIKQVVLLLIYYLSPIVASIIYWFEEPINDSDIINIIHRFGSILGIFGFIWMCFSILIQIKLKVTEENYSLDRILSFHTKMSTIALILGSVHYPLVRIGREYTTIQIRTGSIGFMIFVGLMILALIFMSNLLIKFKFIEKLRNFASDMKLKYAINKFLHNLLVLGVAVIFFHTLVANTSNQSILMLVVYSFFFVLTVTGWFYHKIIRKLRSNSDPYIFRKAPWDTPILKNDSKVYKEWASKQIKQNSSLYPCLQCGTCTEVCPVSKVTQGKYNPRKNILAVYFGYKDQVLEEEDFVIWGCTSCDTCDEMCPQHIKLSETFTYLKNESIALGRGPDSVRIKQKQYMNVVR